MAEKVEKKETKKLKGLYKIKITLADNVHFIAKNGIPIAVDNNTHPVLFYDTYYIVDEEILNQIEDIKINVKGGRQDIKKATFKFINPFVIEKKLATEEDLIQYPVYVRNKNLLKGQIDAG